MSSLYAESLRAFFKPVLQYLDDDDVTEVLVNGPDEVWIERGGKLERTGVRFTPEGLRAAAVNVAQFVGRVLDEERPRLDARLADGSRIHVILPPVSRKGVAIAIRKFFRTHVTMDRFVAMGSVSEAGAAFLEAAVRIKKNLVVSGGTGSGKTTLLNVLSQAIPNHERIVTIEDSAELKLAQEHLLPLESRPADRQGKGEITIADLLHSSLRLRPDRIIIGEVRGPEAFDLVQAMNTGHGGSMCTAHANTPVETLRRLESLCLMHEARVPLVAIRAQLAAALHVIVCCGRFPDGSRRITHISEVLPLDEHGEYRTRDVFAFDWEGSDERGRVRGQFVPTGVVPTFLGELRAHGMTRFDEAFFGGTGEKQEQNLKAVIKETPVKTASDDEADFDDDTAAAPVVASVTADEPLPASSTDREDVSTMPPAVAVRRRVGVRPIGAGFDPEPIRTYESEETTDPQGTAPLPSP